MRGARRALLLATIPLLLAPPAEAQIIPEQRTVVVLAHGLSYGEALDDPTLRAVARAGGIGLLTMSERPDAVVRQIRDSVRIPQATVIEVPSAEAGAAVRDKVENMGVSTDLLVVVVGTAPSRAMLARGENITTVVVSRRPPGDLFDIDGPMRALTSETTRRDGLVSNADIVPTILDFLGKPMPEGITGNPILTSDSPPPTLLLRRYLEYRRVVTPVGVIVLGLALMALVAGVVVILGPWRPPATVVSSIAVVGLFAVSLQVAMLAGSWLSDFSWPIVLGTLAGVGGVVTAAAVWARRRSRYAAVATVAGVGMVLILVDWLLGWRSLLTPLLGGSALEGTRFYGLGNSYAGLLLAGAVLVAALLRPWAGVALLLGAAVFAGAPWAGADLGGGITLFGAAGIWWALGVRRRVGLAEVVGAGAAVVGGAAILILLHRLVGEPSHVSRAVDQAGGLGGILGVFLDRLSLNLETTARTPAVWLALAAVPVAIWVAWRRPGPFRPALEDHPAWREACLVLGLSAALGYALNDTYGLTAVAFVYLALALVYPVLVRKNVRSKRTKVANEQASGLDSRSRFG